MEESDRVVQYRAEFRKGNGTVSTPELRAGLDTAMPASASLVAIMWRCGPDAMQSGDGLDHSQGWADVTVVYTGTPLDGEQRDALQAVVDAHDGAALKAAGEARAAAILWKKELLIASGVDLTSAVDRKLWQNREDLLTPEEAAALVAEWEAR